MPSCLVWGFFILNALHKQIRNQWVVFSKQRSKEAKPKETRKLFAGFLLFSEATFCVIYLKIAKYSGIVNR